MILSTLNDPQSFQNFTQAVPFFQVSGEGLFCFPVDLAAAGISGVQDGANVTLQFTYDGGDGELFQVTPLPPPYLMQSADDLLGSART